MQLRILRLNAGLSPEQLGEQVGVSGDTIRRLETGGRPSARTAKLIADYFGKQATEMWPELVEAA